MMFYAKVFAIFFVVHIAAGNLAEVEGMYDPDGYYSFRPWACCKKACGPTYSFNNGRCIHDPTNKMTAPDGDYSYHIDVFFRSVKSCCNFCGIDMFEFRYEAATDSCVRLPENVNTFVTYGSMYCEMCKFLVLAIQDLNDSENKYELTEEFQKKCNNFYNDKYFCLKLLRLEYENIVKNHLGTTPSKLCHQLQFCDTVGHEITSRLKTAAADIKNGKAILID